jgi:hypothetical protein
MKPDSIADATERVKKILDAKYEKANLHEVAQDAEHLSKTERTPALSANL